jgi:hypothetical protein
VLHPHSFRREEGNIYGILNDLIYRSSIHNNFEVRNIVKAKAVPLHIMKALEGKRRYSSYSFLTSSLDGGEW